MNRLLPLQSKPLSVQHYLLSLDSPSFVSKRAASDCREYAEDHFPTEE